jgi:hemerythrin
VFPWKKSTPKSSVASTFLPWTNDLLIGIKQFDLEHQEMADLINQLHTLMVVQRDRPGADQLTDNLLRITRTHFTNEEALLTSLGYPECEAHFHEHSNLIDELRDLRRQFRDGTISALVTPKFLKKWLLEHTQNTDRKYVPFLRSKGIR